MTEVPDWERYPLLNGRYKCPAVNAEVVITNGFCNSRKQCPIGKRGYTFELEADKKTLKSCGKKEFGEN